MTEPVGRQVRQFQGTAWYYSRYRHPYPPELLKLLIGKFGLDRKGRLLDLGCGTGQLAIPLAKHVEEAVGMDPDPEMLAEAKSQVEHLCHAGGNITWVEAASGDLKRLSMYLGTFKLVTMGRSFHWMDREAVLQVLWEMVVPGGGIAVVSDTTSFWNNTNIWQTAVSAIIQRWLGERRRAGASEYTTPQGRHEEIIACSAFKDIETHTINYQRTWSLDSVIGYLYSTSFSSASVLGDKRQVVEDDIRRTLLELSPSGVFEEDGQWEAVLAWKK